MADNSLSISADSALDALITLTLFAMSTIRSIISRCTWLALTPLRFTWNTTAWALSHAVHITFAIISYPPVMCVLAVIGCGLVIGACAGFGVELLTSMLLSATWGKEKTARSIDTCDMDDGDHPCNNDDEQYYSNEQQEDVRRRLCYSKKSAQQVTTTGHDENTGDDEDQNGQQADNVMYELLQHHLASVANSSDTQQLRRRTPTPH